MKKAIYTITANDYFSQSITLMNSIIDSSELQDVDLFVFIADRKDMRINYSISGVNILFIEDIFKGNEKIVECEFKYNIVEFNVMLKPLIAEFLLEKYCKIIYFDSDIRVYSNVGFIFSKLDSNNLLLAPHHIEWGKETNQSEIDCLRCGYFNLGFFAVKSSVIGMQIINEWKTRLLDYCYMDRFDLYVDQKWMDHLFCVYNKEIGILDDIGCDVAPWNFSERRISVENGKFYVSSRKNNTGKKELVFFHFSGINLFFNSSSNLLSMKKQREQTYSFVDENIYNLCLSYQKELLDNYFEDYLNVDYAFDYFDNGVKIDTLTRSLYKKMIEGNLLKNENPFNCNSSFYKLLEKNRLIYKNEIKIKKGGEHLTDKDIYKTQINKMNKIMRFVKKILGIKRFIALNKYLHYISNQDNMEYLIRK